MFLANTAEPSSTNVDIEIEIRKGSLRNIAIVLPCSVQSIKYKP